MDMVQQINRSYCMDIRQEQQSILSIIAAYIYSATWALSFYGQLVQNYKLKSVQGFSLNYFIMNISGYILYTMYMTIGFFTEIQGAGTVVLADLLFVYHAMAMMILYAIQIVIYHKGRNRIDLKVLIITLAVWLVVILQVTLAGVFQVVGSSQYWNPLSVMGYGKLALVLLKCFPQIYWNYRRKSTVGWSIVNIILDLIGAAFSFISAGLSKYNGLNLSKILLGIFSILIDLTFAFQHYCLYWKKSETDQFIQEKQNIIEQKD